MSRRVVGEGDNAQAVRIDVWLWRARFAKTRSLAQAMVNEGGFRLSRGGLTRRLEKPSAEIFVGDQLLFSQRGQLRVIRVRALGLRRGPATEARALYEDVAEEPNPDLEGVS